MKKNVKLVITIIVIVSIIMFFILSHLNSGNSFIASSPCQKFDKTLSSGIEEYFKFEILNEGESRVVSVDTLISRGYVSSDYLDEIGTSCSGDALVTKANNTLYYYNNINCGSCSIDSLYGNWNDVDTLPNFGKKKSQVIATTLYNYSVAQKYYTDWSSWKDSKEKLENISLPSGSVFVEDEFETKTQYRYRDALYKWYKSSGSKEYFNNGAYRETSPGAGYVKDESSKKVYKTTSAYETDEELRMNVNLKNGDVINSIEAYSVGIPHYIYMYKASSNNVTYTCRKKITVEPFAATASAAMSQCNVAGYVSCQTFEGNGKATSFGYITTSTAKNQTDCKGTTTTCSKASDINHTRTVCTPTTWLKTSMICAKVNNSYSFSGGFTASEVTTDCTNEAKNSISTCSSANVGKAKVGCNAIKWTKAEQKCVAKSYEKIYGYTAYAEDKGRTSCLAGYYVYSTQNNTSSLNYYLKSDGSIVSDISQASYLTETEYANLRSKNPSLAYYEKTGTPTYSYSHDYYEGTCPVDRECRYVKLYKATLYTYKWYKPNSSSEGWCNNGLHSADSPGDGCIKDESTIKWTDWSAYSDTEIKATSSKEVQSADLIRYRKSYINNGALVLPSYLPLQEFENTIGSSLTDFEKTQNVVIRRKYTYKYRLLK